MKKSKTIKLALVSSLLGSGIHALASGHINHPYNSTFTTPSKDLKGYSANPVGFNYCLDSLVRSGGSAGFIHIGVVRGGWGIFGHHNAAAS